MPTKQQKDDEENEEKINQDNTLQAIYWQTRAIENGERNSYSCLGNYYQVISHSIFGYIKNESCYEEDSEKVSKVWILFEKFVIMADEIFKHGFEQLDCQKCVVKIILNFRLLTNYKKDINYREEFEYLSMCFHRYGLFVNSLDGAEVETNDLFNKDIGMLMDAQTLSLHIKTVYEQKYEWINFEQDYEKWIFLLKQFPGDGKITSWIESSIALLIRYSRGSFAKYNLKNDDVIFKQKREKEKNQKKDNFIKEIMEATLMSKSVVEICYDYLFMLPSFYYKKQ
jgi:hypothetical protein